MNRVGVWAAMAAVNLFAAISVQAADTQRVFSDDKTCEMTVPADWKIEKLEHSNADAPDGSASVAVDSAPHFKLAQVKAMIEKQSPPQKTFEDTPQRLWYQSRSGAHGTQWFVGVAGPGGVCSGDINFKNASNAGLAKAIALSIRPAS